MEKWTQFQIDTMTERLRWISGVDDPFIITTARGTYAITETFRRWATKTRILDLSGPATHGWCYDFECEINGRDPHLNSAQQMLWEWFVVQEMKQFAQMGELTFECMTIPDDGFDNPQTICIERKPTETPPRVEPKLIDTIRRLSWEVYRR